MGVGEVRWISWSLRSCSIALVYIILCCDAFSKPPSCSEGRWKACAECHGMAPISLPDDHDPRYPPRPSADTGDGTDSDGHASSERDSIPRLSYFYEPFPQASGAFMLQIGGSFSMLPEPIAEQEIPVPALDVQCKYGIRDNVSLVGSLSTNIFSNIVHGGIQWNTQIDRFSVGIATHMGLAYGFIRAEDLFDDVHAYALFVMPIVRFGYRFDECSVSSSFVATYVFASESYVNSMQASIGPENTVNDLFCTLAVEQPFLGNLHVSLGLSLGYARTPYQSWMLYNTLDEWLFVPEFFFAVQL